MSVNRHRIGIIPIGDISDIIPKVIAAHISGYLKQETIVSPPMRTPSYAMDKNRLQYNVGTIISEMESNPFEEFDKVVGILGVDLFVPVFTHVFGEARQGGKVALVSLFRLGDAAILPESASSLVLERAAKIALHELCHLYNLAHCENHRCLMHFSGNLDDLDETPFYFCRYCWRYFQNAVKEKPTFHTHDSGKTANREKTLNTIQIKKR